MSMEYNARMGVEGSFSLYKPSPRAEGQVINSTEHYILMSCRRLNAVLTCKDWALKWCPFN